MEQQQQLQGPHWSWINLLDLSRNLTKPYVEAQQERQRIKLGEYQAQTQALSFMQIANSMRLQNVAFQREVDRDALPDFTSMRPIVKDVTASLGVIRTDNVSQPKVTDLFENFTLSPPLVTGNRMYTDITDKVANVKIGRIYMYKNPNGTLSLYPVLEKNQYADTFKNCFMTGNRLGSTIHYWLKLSAPTFLTSFEEAAKVPQTDYTSDSKTSVDAAVSKSEKDLKDALDLINRGIE